MKRLYRSESDRMLTGVCGGIGEVYDIDPSLVRIIVFFLALVTFPIGVLAYIFAALIIPTESELEQ